MIPSQNSWQITLSQLIRLRWLAVLGQACAVAGSALAGIELPLEVLVSLIALVALSNLLITMAHLRDQTHSKNWLTSVVVFDVALLTAMLYSSGGVHNPFTSFYLLQLVIAALTLETRAAWIVAGLCALGFLVLFLSPHPLLMPNTHIGQITFNLHMQGMFVAFTLTGLFITYFVTRLTRALMHSELLLARSRNQAEHAERLASLATLAAGVAHELATPLATISVISHEWETARKMNLSRFAADSRVITTQVERCQQILSKLNRSSTDGIGETPHPTSLSELLAALARILLSGQKERLVVENNAGDIELFIPKESVIQALATLIKNACEAEGSDGPVRLLIQTDARSLSFRVRDNGIGVSPEDLPHLGEPFFTTKAPGRGMGLGLFLVRTLAERLGGSLEVASTPETGSEFTFRLAVNEPDAGVYD